jgi:peroxiredoxin/CheY-like chemotaxis protein
MFNNREGERIPSDGIVFRAREGGEWKDVTIEQLFASKRVVLFALPGAFTPTCSTTHVPRFNELAQSFKVRGVHEIVCVSVNDPFVMEEWAKEQNAPGIRFLPDGNAEFTSAMGMLVDKRTLGLGQRSWRYSMLVDDGVIKKMFIEPVVDGDPFEVSDADTMLRYLDPSAKVPREHTSALGDRECRLAVRRDVAERLRLEEQLRQAQKMEAIGRLAGGVAHDFNNVLSVILGYGEMLLADTTPGDPRRGDIEEIHRAGMRAADLTRQLLTFSRQQVLAPKVLDLNDVLTSMDKMLRRILGADVDLVSLPAESLGRVRADPSNVEQVIMNLAVNARDAMPTGGKLTIETSNVILDERYARSHLGVKPGPHVMLAVTDSGTGIDKATLARIFEPFFTTKDSGKGTGLGLSTVFGVVQQSGGSVWVYSELGQGTTFKVYLPRVDAAVETARSVAPPASLRGSETILLVEDDDQVRLVARSILRKSGYLVIEAANAAEALLHSEMHQGTIDLLLSDVVMPQVSGPELARRLASDRPNMKVLCMSGYTDDSIVRHGVLDAHIAYLQKPITRDALTSRVREVLDGTPTGKAA